MKLKRETLWHWATEFFLLNCLNQSKKNVLENGNALTFYFEITCYCKIIFIFIFKFPRSFHLSVQNQNTEQNIEPCRLSAQHRAGAVLLWAELSLVFFPPHIPLSKSIWSDFCRSLQIDSLCWQSMFLVLFLVLISSSSDSTNFHGHRVRLNIFLCD